VLKRYCPRIPGAVVVFIVAMVAGQLVDFPAHGIAVIGTVDRKLPNPLPPELSMQELATLMVSAVGMAFLIFPEGIVLGRSVASRHGYAINPDRELLALGMANLATGLLRSFAVGSSQTRTLLNDATGGAAKWSACWQPGCSCFS
jgi:SulP family sulfate permease